METIVFTGGGTLGHVMPNLYLIDELKSQFHCVYLGSDGPEMARVPKDVEFFCIPAVKLTRGKIFCNLKIPFVLVNAIFKAKKILKKIHPALIFSKGGYVSLPVCVAAKMLKIPIIAHESDYSFGLANKIILRLCTKMCVNFKILQQKSEKIVYTGPIFAKSFDSSAKANKFVLHLNKPTILILGGSLGAKAINELVKPIVDELIKDFNIIHILGKQNTKEKSRLNYTALPFYKNMTELYNLADFVIGRSGAGVSSECFYKKIPMLLIPLENKSTRGDQLLNAQYYQNLKVAKLLHQSALDSQKLKSEIYNFYANIKSYKNAYLNLQQVNGRQKVVDLICFYATKNINPH